MEVRHDHPRIWGLGKTDPDGFPKQVDTGASEYPSKVFRISSIGRQNELPYNPELPLQFRGS